jgi:hypothetical protein
VVARPPSGYLKPYHWTGRTAVTPTPFGDSCRPAQSPQPPGSTSCSHQQSDHPLLSTGQALTSTVAYQARRHHTAVRVLFSRPPRPNHTPRCPPAVSSLPASPPDASHTNCAHPRRARSPSASLDPTWPRGLKGSPHTRAPERTRKLALALLSAGQGRVGPGERRLRGPGCPCLRARAAAL